MQFRTRKDGTVYPLGGSSKKKGAGAFVAGAALVGAAAFGGSGGFIGGGAADGLSAAAQARVVKAQKAAAQGKRGQAWRRVGVRQSRNRVERRLSCARNSHGEVREFFVLTPCRSLKRGLFLLTDGRGGSLVLSVYWVRMRDRAAAQALKGLDDTYGTGNVNPIAARFLGLGGVTFTGKYYDSRLSGAMTVIAEAEPVTGAPTAETLESVAQVATYFPAP